MFGREYECAHAEGISTVAYARGSHAEGVCTSAFGMYSHVEGLSCCTIDLDIEGLNNRHGTFAHAEGLATSAVGNDSHAEGSHMLKAMHLTQKDVKLVHLATTAM